MGQVWWQGRTVTAEVLFEAAREARTRSWLDEPSRLFLHRIGLALASGGAPSPGELHLLQGLLDTLRRQGSFAMASLLGQAEPVRWTAPPLPTPGRSDPVALASLEADLGRLSLMLAAAAERLEACREEVGRRLHPA